jgi:cytochrome c-type biogenesis protein CcmE
MSAKLAPKHQRLVLLSVALLALLGAVLLAIWGVKNQASYYYIPSELLAAKPSPDQPGRLGGMVEAGSFKTAADGVTVHFVVGDCNARVPVTYKGILPDLFTEGSGVVAEGHLLADGVFVADNLLAKHDENYVPRELKDMTEAQKRATVEETTK